jgi:D-amino peptidase
VKVYISADIEGITGLVSWSQCSRPDGLSYDYQFARRMMTHDVNAAIRGARAAGATEIVLKDSHGNSKNLLIEDLEPGVRMVSGHGAGIDGMMQGIDETFDCALLVGYHAMAGTIGGVMEHTITGGVHRLWVNGIESGEMGLSAGVAGRYGVPLVMVSSDAAGCAEAEALIPGVETAVTKTGVGRYMAELLHPSETGPLIEAAAKRGVERAKEIAAHVWDEPSTVRVEFNRSEEADMGQKLLSVPLRVNGYTCEGTYPTYEDAHRVVWNLMAMSFEGIGSQK